jgi:hypothetical protein
MTQAPFDNDDNNIVHLLSSLNRLPSSSIAVSDVAQHDIHTNDATAYYTDAVDTRVSNGIQTNNEVSVMYSIHSFSSTYRLVWCHKFHYSCTAATSHNVATAARLLRKNLAYESISLSLSVLCALCYVAY